MTASSFASKAESLAVRSSFVTSSLIGIAFTFSSSVVSTIGSCAFSSSFSALSAFFVSVSSLTWSTALSFSTVSFFSSSTLPSLVSSTFSFSLMSSTFYFSFGIFGSPFSLFLDPSFVWFFIDFLSSETLRTSFSSSGLCFKSFLNKLNIVFS